MTLADLAAALGCPFEGDGSLNLVRVATIEQAGPGDLTFLANMKYARALGRTRAQRRDRADPTCRPPRARSCAAPSRT